MIFVFGLLKKKNKLLQEQIDKLSKEVAALKTEVEGLKKRTISQTTMEQTASPSFSDIVDEWLNGKKEEDSGK